MAVLPYDPLNFRAGVSFQDEPGRTWALDREAGRIVGEVDGFAAVAQAVHIILWTQRYAWFIYEPSSGVDYRGLIGQDPGFVATELQRRIADALRMDSRVTGVRDYAFSFSEGVLSVSFVVTTVYGDLEEDMEVPLV